MGLLLLVVAEMERCTLWWGGDWRLVGCCVGPPGPICRSDRDEPDCEPSDSSCGGQGQVRSGQVTISSRLRAHEADGVMMMTTTMMMMICCLS